MLSEVNIFYVFFCPGLYNTAILWLLYFYHGILQMNYRKMTIKWSFSYNFFVKIVPFHLYHAIKGLPCTPGRVAQSVTCLASDACLTADQGVASSIPVRSHTFVEIDHEIISTVILLPSADLFKKGCCQLQAKVCARITG